MVFYIVGHSSFRNKKLGLLLNIRWFGWSMEQKIYNYNFENFCHDFFNFNVFCTTLYKWYLLQVNLLIIISYLIDENITRQPACKRNSLNSCFRRWELLSNLHWVVYGSELKLIKKLPRFFHDDNKIKSGDFFCLKQEFVYSNYTCVNIYVSWPIYWQIIWVIYWNNKIYCKTDYPREISKFIRGNLHGG